MIVGYSKNEVALSFLRLIMILFVLTVFSCFVFLTTVPIAIIPSYFLFWMILFTMFGSYSTKKDELIFSRDNKVRKKQKAISKMDELLVLDDDQLEQEIQVKIFIGEFSCKKNNKKELVNFARMQLSKMRNQEKDEIEVLENKPIEKEPWLNCFWRRWVLASPKVF